MEYLRHPDPRTPDTQTYTEGTVYRSCLAAQQENELAYSEVAASRSQRTRLCPNSPVKWTISKDHRPARPLDNAIPTRQPAAFTDAGANRWAHTEPLGADACPQHRVAHRILLAGQCGRKRQSQASAYATRRKKVGGIERKAGQQRRS